MPDIFYYILVSFLASVIGAISGIGGGIIMKPVLEMLSNDSVEVISFLSGCTVLAMSAVSLLRSRRSPGQFELRRGTLLALGSVAGGILGKSLFDQIRAAWGSVRLGAIQSAALCVSILLLLLYLANKKNLAPKNFENNVQCMLLGLFLGMFSAFLGIGGGPLNLAALSYFLSMDNKKAAIYSLYIIFFSQTSNLVLSAAQGKIPAHSTALLICMICGGIFGGLVGSAISKRLDSAGVGRLYGAVLILVLVISGGNLLGYMGI